MGDTSRDPIDHSRTTRQHAGETMKNGSNAPGLISAGLGVAAFVLGLAAFANGHPTSGWVGVAVAVVLGAIGGTWLYVAHRRVREYEIRLAQNRPDAEAPPPTS
jgi:tetrahydromethanopterin S-methyltransferase subunit C